MEFDENRLAQRFDRAVSDVTPDVMALVEGGRVRGAALQRRRRVATGAGLVAAAAVTVGAVALGQGLFDHESAGPTDPSPTGVEQLVPATPRGMAAAVVDLLGTGEPFAVGGQTEPPDSSGATQVEIDTGYRVDGEKFEIQVVATSAVNQWGQVGGCSTPQPGSQTIWCDDTPLADGTPALRALMKATSDRSTGSPPTFVAIAAVKREDQVVGAFETVLGRDGVDYAPDTLPVSVDRLMALATDPRIGLHTTAAYNEAGKDIEGFRDSALLGSGSGSSSGSGASGGSVVTAAPGEPVTPSTAPSR